MLHSTVLTIISNRGFGVREGFRGFNGVDRFHEAGSGPLAAGAPIETTIAVAIRIAATATGAATRIAAVDRMATAGTTTTLSRR